MGAGHACCNHGKPAEYKDLDVCERARAEGRGESAKLILFGAFVEIGIGPHQTVPTAMDTRAHGTGYGMRA